MSTNRDRDETMDRLLRRALRDGSAADTSACPDADVVAAYVERALPGPERAAFERHAAGCARCQATLAALADLPPLVAEAADEPGVKVLTWWRGWRTWLVPAAIAASAAALYVGIQPPAAPPSPDSTVASRETSGPTGGAADSADARQMPSAQTLRDQAAPTAAVPAPTVAAAPPAPTAADKQRANAPARSAPPRPGADASQDTLVAAAAPPPAERAFAPAPPAPIAAPAQAPTPAASAIAERLEPAPRPGAENEVRREASAENVAAGAARAPETAVGGARAKAEQAPAPAAAPSAFGALQNAPAAGVAKMARADTTAASSRSPDDAVTWRVGPGGAIARSVDGGRSWVPQATGVGADLLAVSAYDARTCWAVGRAGTILLTTEGERWRRLEAPVADDFDRVRATGPLGAIVTTTGGRSFQTSDGGRTWQPR